MPDLRNMTAIYFTRGEELLLLYRMGSRVVGDSWTGAAGGHFEKEELNDPRACILREMAEEIGLTAQDVPDMRLRYVTLRLKNGEIRQNYYFFAAWPEGRPLPQSNEGRLRWHPISQVVCLPQPVTARYVLQHYAATGRFDELLYGGVTTEEGVVFIPMREF